MRAVLLLAFALLAGCLAPAATAPEPPAAASALVVGDATLHASGVRGGLSLLHLGEGAEATVELPPGALVLGAGDRLAPPDGPVRLARGELVQFLAPWAATQVDLTLRAGGAERVVTLPLEEARGLVAGERVIELLREQEARFPYRYPSHPNYMRAVEDYAAKFEALGYEVEVFRPPLLPDLNVPVQRQPGTGSFVSVVATKRGVDEPERRLVVGGHFDVVEETTHGAFDNTGGAMSVLAMAEAFARVNTSRSMVFALWGGEEDGVYGSQAWLSAHPELVPTIDMYVNYDVSGMAWPAPLADPAPIVATTGPDGPLADAMAQRHRAVVSDWMQLAEAPFVYEPVAQGQATGAGVNAQSDHRTFLARGIPVLMQFTSRVPEARALIHKHTDTLENMTRYALRGVEGLDSPLNATEAAQGEALLAESYEVQLAAGFYLLALTDAGVLPDPRPPLAAPLR